MTPAYSHPLRIAELVSKRAYSFDLTPDDKTREAIAAELGIVSLRKLRVVGTLSPLGRKDWQLEAEMGATVVQDCVTTLDPVTTRIDEPIKRTYLHQIEYPTDEEEVEIPEDDSIDPLPEVLDLGEVILEALALALPAYPQVPGAKPLVQAYTAPGVDPLTDEATKPFAGLAALRDKLGGGNDPESDPE
mgnify:CR=1 FL=1